MMPLRTRGVLMTCALVLIVPLMADPALMQQAAKRPLEVADVPAWRAIGVTAVSNDGQWFAYRIGPGEGDADVVVRNTKTSKELKFAIGDPQATMPPGAAPPPAAPPAAPAAVSLVFSEDSKWMAFSTYPARKEAERLRRQRRPVQTGATVVNLATGERKDYPKIRRFAFSGETSSWIAMHRYPAQAGPGAGAAAPAGPAAPAAPPAAAGGAGPTQPRGSDLILRELAAGQDLNVGNVADFAFNDSGRFLCLTIDAQDQAGNGVHLRDMSSSAVTVLDSGLASYERPSWTEKGDALAVLEGSDAAAYRDKTYVVLGFSGIGAGAPKKTVYDPASDKTFPEGMAVSPNRAPQWTDDLQAILFGIHYPRPKDTPAKGEGETPPPAGGDEPRPAADAPAGPSAEEKVDLVLWHWKDDRLQSQQEVQETRDRNFSYLAEYRVQPQKFIRLADDEVRTVNPAPTQKWALGLDDREYELMGNLDGRRFQDVYAINLETGQRKLAMKRVRWLNAPSPDGRGVLFYEDGNFQIYSFETAQIRNITQTAPVSFVDTEADVNIVKPPAQAVGWTSDSKSVLLSDNWDIWQVPVDGGQALNLTINGRKDSVRYQRRFALEPVRLRDDGIDLSKPQFFAAYGEWTKKGGIARIDPGKAGVQMVAWGDAAYTRLLKAEDAESYIYTRETVAEPADFHVADAGLSNGQRLTDQREQVAQFNWSAGSILVNYTSDKGDKLQAALFLPANYEKGKAYPTVVNFYEKMSQTANTFSVPTANGFNRSVYTSNGYAVLMPDMTYKVNDPGLSAVWCMVPAVKAAIATGIVDAKKIGITGHSWGGYQTAFLVTQTDIFAAAVAGAPLTNMVSMYSLIYKNTGGTNQPIFESSQGRFRGGYWDNWDAYYRNSPVFFAKNVKTPLMILHNDKDGAVDFTQGVEYFNTLRRLQKPVIMLEYVGENHGLRKPSNQRDYSARMKEYFDHYLMGGPAPDWLTKGVPRLKMEDHLKERAKPKPPARRITTTTDAGR
jgi:dipeptidyl aminopeptidase/acylaminoacyl peptidase